MKVSLLQLSENVINILTFHFHRERHKLWAGFKIAAGQLAAFTFVIYPAQFGFQSNFRTTYLGITQNEKPEASSTLYAMMINILQSGRFGSQIDLLFALYFLLRGANHEVRK